MISMGIFAPAYFASVLMVFSSVILGMLSGSALMVWLMMEFGVCSFCGVLSFAEFGGGEGVAKYFLVNAFSGVGIFSGMLSEWPEMLEGYDLMLLDMSLFMGFYTKLGLPPFHFWVVGVLRECNWFSAFLLLVVQKVLPVVFLCYSFEFSAIVILVAVLSAGSAGLAGLGHYEPYFLIGYSSMVVGNWLVMISFVSGGTLLASFMLYAIGLMGALSCLREGQWKGKRPFMAPNNWEVVGVLMLVLPIGPVYLMKMMIWGGLSGCGCVLGAWGVAFTSVLLVPLYMRVLMVSVVKLWKQSLTNTYYTGMVWVPLWISMSVFVVSGFAWSVDYWFWVL